MPWNFEEQKSRAFQVFSEVPTKLRRVIPLNPESANKIILASFVFFFHENTGIPGKKVKIDYLSAMKEAQ